MQIIKNPDKSIWRELAQRPAFEKQALTGIVEIFFKK